MAFFYERVLFGATMEFPLCKLSENAERAVRQRNIKLKRRLLWLRTFFKFSTLLEVSLRITDDDLLMNEFGCNFNQKVLS